MEPKKDFDDLMKSLAELEAPAPKVVVDVKRVLETAESRRPLLWRNCAIASLVAMAAALAIAFTLWGGAPSEAATDSLDEVYQECENVFAFYSYSDMTGR